MYELDLDIVNGTAFFYVWASEPWSKKHVIEAANREDVHTIVVLGQEEWEPLHLGNTSKEIDELVSQLGNVKLFICYGGVKDKWNKRYYVKDSRHILSWPNYFAHVIVDRHDKTGYPDRTPKLKKLNRHFVSLNGRPHHYRCQFIDEMYGRGLFDYGNISWHEFDIKDYREKYEFKYWTPKKREFDADFRQPNGMCDIFIPPVQFETSIFSIISESNLDCMFFTEKTWLPMYHQKPILLYAHPYSHRWLERQGYKLHKNIINYSFDHEEDDTKRLAMMLDELEKICSMDLEDLYKKTISVAVYNRNKLLEDLKNKTFAPPIIQKFLKKFQNQKQINSYHRVLNIGVDIEKVKK